MKLETGKLYSGFKLLSEREVKEINCIGRIFLHEKSGARLLYLESEDDNKVFSVSFRTPPENSTGLPHILEHSVLGGSRKFPAKDPFIELAKGSLNTFLNAMTFSDKTMYPIASRNEKDFFNLMDVYMDSVLYPSIYSTPETFMQEGWHYELEDKEGDAAYRGVVYSEMKGAFSAPESILFRKIQESLFPDTPYGVESGGDPDVIPQLTNDEFLNFHRKYYHPSNSYIFLYGNGDILKQLQFLDENYLSSFSRMELDSRIPVQKPFGEMREMMVEYPAAEGEDLKDKTFLNMNFVVGRSTDPDLYLALEILEHLLLETPAAPLKKALIDANLGKDVLGRFDNSILQPVFSIVVKNTNEDEKQRFRDVVFETLKGLARDGIDKELVEASINIKEFELREADFRGYPKGLIYDIKCMDSWLYDEDPLLHLAFQSTIERIRNAAKSNYFEKMIEDYLLDNSHCSMIVLKPEKGLSERKAEELKKELSEYKSSLSSEEIESLIRQTMKLKERQSSPDTREALEAIPLLSLEDIEKKAEKLPLEERNESGIKILYHPISTNGIAYLNLYFDSMKVKQELIPYAGLLSEVLGKSGTNKYSYSALSNAVNIHTGGIDFSGEVYIKNGDYNIYYPMFVVKSKALLSKLPKLVEIAGEIISGTIFNEKKRLLEIIREAKSRIEISMYNQGNRVAARRVMSYFSLSGKYDELVNGLGFYKFLTGIEKDYEKSADSIIKNLQEVSKSIFNKNNLIMSFTCDGDGYERFKNLLPGLIDSLEKSDLQNYEYKFELNNDNEGLLTQAKVQYCAKGSNFIKLGYKYSGSLVVLSTIAGYDYLWNRIRVQGGAYGTNAVFSRSGNMYLTSYRDPNLKRTLDVYDGLSVYLENFDADKREITKYIIGTVSRLDHPLTPAMKAEKSDANYINGVTQEDIQQERDEVLKTTADDIKGTAPLIRDAMAQDYLCVLGNESLIKQNRDIFSNLVDVFE